MSEFSPGGNPRCQETKGIIGIQTRSEPVVTSKDVSNFGTQSFGTEDRKIFNELMATCKMILKNLDTQSKQLSKSKVDVEVIKQQLHLKSKDKSTLEKEKVTAVSTPTTYSSSSSSSTSGFKLVKDAPKKGEEIDHQRKSLNVKEEATGDQRMIFEEEIEKVDVHRLQDKIVAAEVLMNITIVNTVPVVTDHITETVVTYIPQPERVSAATKLTSSEPTSIHTNLQIIPYTTQTTPQSTEDLKGKRKLIESSKPSKEVIYRESHMKFNSTYPNELQEKQDGAEREELIEGEHQRTLEVFLRADIREFAKEGMEKLLKNEPEREFVKAEASKFKSEEPLKVQPLNQAQP